MYENWEGLSTSQIQRVLAQFCVSSIRDTEYIKFQEMSYNRKIYSILTHILKNKKGWSLQRWLCQTGLSYVLQLERMKARK